MLPYLSSACTERVCAPSGNVSVFANRIAKPDANWPVKFCPLMLTSMSRTSRSAMMLIDTAEDRDTYVAVTLEDGESVSAAGCVAGKSESTLALDIAAGVDFPNTLIAFTSNLYCVLSWRLSGCPLSSSMIHPENVLSGLNSPPVVQLITVFLPTVS